MCPRVIKTTLGNDAKAIKHKNGQCEIRFVMILTYNSSESGEMDIKNTYDVVIIGGAVMGSSAAFWLSKMAPGLDILVVEADPTYHKSSTALSVASIRQQFTTDVNVKISRFGIEFIKKFSKYTGQEGEINSLGFQQNGYLFLCGDDNNAKTMRKACNMQCKHGADTRLLAPKDLKSRFDWLNVSDIRLASFGARDEGWFDNMGLLSVLKKAAIAANVQYLNDKVVALTTKSGQINAVSLQENGEISAGIVINAAGTSAGHIMNMLGEELCVEARKRTVFMIDAPNAIHPDAPLVVCHSGFYFRPEYKKWLTAIVPQNDHSVDENDFEPDLKLFEDVIWPKLYARAPGFDAVKVVSAWAGHYAYNTLDQNAIIGAHPNWENLFLMNGFSGHGLQQAPAIGRGISELILHNKFQSIDLNDLSVERILAGKPFLEKAIV